MSFKKSNFVSIKRCNVCQKNEQEVIFNINQFPLTGIYLNKDEYLKKFDNQFLICRNCGHGQLKNQIDPTFLYQKSYTHRTSKSPLAVKTNNDFKKRLLKIIKNRQFNCVLEIGCNDLFLAKQIRKFSKSIIGIDPIVGGGG